MNLTAEQLLGARMLGARSCMENKGSNAFKFIIHVALTARSQGCLFAFEKGHVVGA